MQFDFLCLHFHISIYDIYISVWLIVCHMVSYIYVVFNSICFCSSDYFVLDVFICAIYCVYHWT